MTLQIRNLHKRFGDVQALDGISFDVQPGERRRQRPPLARERLMPRHRCGGAEWHHFFRVAGGLGASHR
jgi:hypothetical protein